MRAATLILLLAATLASCGGQTPRKEHKGRSIVLDGPFFDKGATDTIRFGKLGSGEIAVLRFWIENASERPAAITSYTRSCGCTSLTFSKEPIAPGEARQVEMTFDSRGEYGWQLKTVDLRFAGAERPLRLYVEADVR